MWPWQHLRTLLATRPKISSAHRLRRRKRQSRNTTRDGHVVRLCSHPARAARGAELLPWANRRGSPPTRSASKRAGGNDRGAASQDSPFLPFYPPARRINILLTSDVAGVSRRFPGRSRAALGGR